jgi:hypothetical protein
VACRYNDLVLHTTRVYDFIVHRTRPCIQGRAYTTFLVDVSMREVVYETAERVR